MIRLWLSYDDFQYEEDRQSDQFETAMQICAGKIRGIKKIPKTA